MSGPAQRLCKWRQKNERAIGGPTRVTRNVRSADVPAVWGWGCRGEGPDDDRYAAKHDGRARVDGSRALASVRDGGERARPVHKLCVEARVMRGRPPREAASPSALAPALM